MSVRDDILAAIERLRTDTGYQPHTHVVHPLARGWTICADCGAPIYIQERT
jgi:hypothetical protein